MLITCNSIYIYDQIAVNSVNGKANLHIDLKHLILINICLILLISHGFIQTYMSKNPVDKS